MPPNGKHSPHTEPRPTQTRLGGKAALVTGAGSGIGRAIALQLAHEGARVFVLDVSGDTADETADRIRSQGGEASAIQCDVADTQSVHLAFQSVGALHVLVNSAGIAHIGTVEETAPEELDRVYRVNVKGTFHGMHFGVPLMLKSGGGAILNMSSFAARIGIPQRFAYSMSKGAILSMTRSVACDYVRQGIRCNCLCPARIHTAFVDRFLDEYHPTDRELAFRQLSEFQPMGRMGRPEEVAALASFLCSSEAGFITGAIYDIDGGVVSLR